MIVLVIAQFVIALVLCVFGLIPILGIIVEVYLPCARSRSSKPGTFASCTIQPARPELFLSSLIPAAGPGTGTKNYIFRPPQLVQVIQTAGNIMLDLKKCPKCREQTDLKNEVCPYCGYPFSEPDSPCPVPLPASSHRAGARTVAHRYPAGRTVCPVCRVSLVKAGRSRTVFVIAGFVTAVLVLALLIFYLPSFPGGNAQPSAMAQNVTIAPTMPQCNIAIIGQSCPEIRSSSTLCRSPATGRCLETAGERERQRCRDPGSPAGSEGELPRPSRPGFRCRGSSLQQRVPEDGD